MHMMLYIEFVQKHCISMIDEITCFLFCRAIYPTCSTISHSAKLMLSSYFLPTSQNKLSTIIESLLSVLQFNQDSVWYSCL